MPGLVFQCGNVGQSIMKIVTQSGRVVHAPTLFVHGIGTERSIMHFSPGPYTIVQFTLKPHALYELFTTDVSALTNSYLGSTELGAKMLNAQLLGATSTAERVTLLGHFLATKKRHAKEEDSIVMKSLQIIDNDISEVSASHVLERLPISERQFQRRFLHVVGLSPQVYIRIRRFNEAMLLVDSGKYERLSDIAAALNYHDQSHFIRDIKLFSGVTPKSISQKVGDFYRDRVSSSYYIESE